ncbi:MAG: hypothetical protein WC908_03390 [Candidatus Paceibacterota bacterium]
MDRTVQIISLVGWAILFGIWVESQSQYLPFVGIPNNFMLVTYLILVVIGIYQASLVWNKQKVIVPWKFLNPIIIGLYLLLFTMTVSQVSLLNIGLCREVLLVFRLAVLLLCGLLLIQVYADTKGVSKDKLPSSDEKW